MADKKQLVDPLRLAQWITDELRKQPGSVLCTAYTSCHTMTLTDCNWSPSYIVAQDIVGDAFNDSLATVLKAAKERFTVI